MFYHICLALKLFPLTPPDRPGTRVLCCPSIRLGNPETHRPDRQGLEKTCSCWRELPLEAWSTLVVATEYSAVCVFDFASFVYLHVSLLESVCRAFVHLRPKCCLIVEVVCVCFLTLQRVCSCIFTFNRTPGINFSCALVSWRAKRRHLILNPHHFLVSYDRVDPPTFWRNAAPKVLKLSQKVCPWT